MRSMRPGFQTSLDLFRPPTGEEWPEILQRAQDDNFVTGRSRLESRAFPRFELKAAYVSVFSMSAQPPSAKVAGSLIAEIAVAPGNAAPSTIGAPTIEEETRAEEELDVRWQV